MENQKRKKLRETFESIHMYWREKGSSCPNDGKCVDNSIGTYNILEKIGGLDDTSELLKIQTTILQSEIRHSALVKKDNEQLID